VVNELGGVHIVVGLAIEVKDVLTGDRYLWKALAPLASQGDHIGVFIDGVNQDPVSPATAPSDQGHRDVPSTAAHVEESVRPVAIPGPTLAPQERQHRLDTPQPAIDWYKVTKGIQRLLEAETGAVHPF
jgi:hypothetical protein